MTLILVPEITAAKKEEVLAKVEKILVAAKGKVEKKEEWGKKSLAYPIKKMAEGDYHFWEVALPESAPAEIDKKMRLEEQVLRYLLLRKE